jgi:hypothetical protein
MEHYRFRQAGSSGGGLAGRQAFDDPELEALVALDLEALGAQVLQRSAPQVLTAK